MTISSDTRKAGPFDGNNVVVTFPFAFTIFRTDDLLVIHTDAAGVESTLTDGPDYSATMNPDQNSNPGGTVTLAVPLPIGEKLTITSALAYLQTLDLTNQGGFYPDVIEAALDKIVVLCQQNAEQLSRSIKIGISDSTPADQYRDSLLQASRDAVNAAAAAATSEGNAATSEGNAHASELAAAQSASNAATSEGNAAGSASASAGSASAAHGSELAAAQSASNAATSEGNALASEQAASTSEGNAVTSENNAHASELAAAASEGNAAGSESAAATSAAAAQGYLNAMTTRFTLVKTYDGQAIIKTGPASASIRAGTYVSVAGAYKQFLVDTAISMPAMTAGTDYGVWVHPDGTASAVADPYSSPAVAPVVGAVKIGGFHNSLIPAGTTVASEGLNTASVTASGGSMPWTQADLDRIIGINEFSIWDLAFRCAGEQRGMTFEPLYREWWGIYFISTDGDTLGPSAALSDVASGTVLPFVAEAWGGDGVLKYAALNGWTAHEMVSRFGLHLPLYDRFQAAAFGVTEGISLGGASSTIPATAHQAKYASRIGLEQATGHAWAIGAPTNAVGGSAYAGNGRGSWYGSYGLPLLGGARDNAANSGSRCAYFGNALSSSYWTYGVRAAGDHLNLGRTAR